jgi:hypothetical protein
MTRHRSAFDDLGELVLIAALLWGALALLRFILQRPKLWPVIVLAIVVAKCY